MSINQIWMMKLRWVKIVLGILVILGLVIGAVVVWASRPTSATLVEQASRSEIEGIKKSLFWGADVNGYSFYGWHGNIKHKTPLSAAVCHGSLETVKFLLSQGADPNQRDGSGMPPICGAAIHGRLGVAKALIEAGADVALPQIDFYGEPQKTAIEYAQSQRHSELLEYLSKIDKKN